MAKDGYGEWAVSHVVYLHSDPEKKQIFHNIQYLVLVS